MVKEINLGHSPGDAESIMAGMSEGLPRRWTPQGPGSPLITDREVQCSTGTSEAEVWEKLRELLSLCEQKATHKTTGCPVGVAHISKA